MKWILILMMLQSHNEGGALATAEFDTKEACMIAGDSVMNTEYSHVKAYCYPTSNQ